jgi:GMP synthase-like glutamine amidotransferase
MNHFALIIMHEESTPPGTTLLWLKQNNINYDLINASHQNLSVDMTKYSIVFICGGIMNLDQEEQFPWLIEEKKLIKKLIVANIKLVGLCLGAQLIADALGAKVFTGEKWEAGWQDVLLNSNETLKVFQFHGQQFTLPKDALHLGKSFVCENQFFTYGDSIMAFQFHPEATVEWTTYCSKSINLPKSDIAVQTPEEILRDNHYQLKLQNWYFEKLKSFLL